MQIETERLILRSFQETDLEAIYEIFSDPVVNRFLPMFPLKTLDEARLLFAERYAGEPMLHFAICLKTDGVPIGYIQVSEGDAHDFGYGLKEDFWHQGIVREAAEKVLELARAAGLPFVTATHDIHNPRSGSVMRAIGMRYCYSYEEQWQPKNFPVIFRLYQINFNCPEEFIYPAYRIKYPNHFVESLE